MVKIAKGMENSYKNFIDVSVDEAILILQRRTDCYEVLEDFNRPYGDIDGKMPPSIEEVEFNKIDNDTRVIIETFLTANTFEYSLMTASSFEHKKISWRFVILGYEMSKEDNKRLIKKIQTEIVLPTYVQLDTGVYGKNQKMRMLNSNKDKQVRPLRLIKGNIIDTLISYLPAGTEHYELPKEEEKPKKKEKKEDNAVIKQLLQGISIKRLTEYDTWVQCGMICFNEGVSIDTWDIASQRAHNYTFGECEKKWATFTKGSIGIGTLWSWLKEDNPEYYDTLKNLDYETIKDEFEKTHFKLMDPSVFGRLDNKDVQLKKFSELHHCYANKFVGKHNFIDMWIKDPKIRTYERLTFQPMKVCSKNEFNLFTGYPTEPVEGDISSVHAVLDLISDFNPEYKEYIENYFAHLFQKPYEKPGITLVFQSEEKGVGKDTYGDFIGSILGKYFYNTGTPENDVFSKFNGCIEKSLLIKFEEANFETNKTNVEGLKSLITASKMSYTRKGQDSITLPSFCRLIMTTNNFVPVVADDTERRYVLFKVSSSRRGDLDWWDAIHAELVKEEVKSAYLHYLLNKDISNFVIRKYPDTHYHREVKQSLAPFHSKFFSHQVRTMLDGQTKVYDADELYTEMFSGSKFVVNHTRFGRDMAIYVSAGVVEKKRSNKGNTYRFTKECMREFLETKGWWVDL